MILIIGWQCADDVVVMLGLAATTRAPWGSTNGCVWVGGAARHMCQSLSAKKTKKHKPTPRGRKKLLVGPIFGAFWCVLGLGFLVDGSPLNDD